MKVRILRNLAGNYPAFMEGEVRNIDNDLAADLIHQKLAEETDEPVTKDVEKNPAAHPSSAAPITAAQTAREMDAAKAGGQTQEETDAKGKKKPGPNPTEVGKSL